jgi:L-histidine Nalpha-methyltransferase
MKSSAATAQTEFVQTEREQFLDDVLSGLNAEHKTLDPKYFYDETGSRLFEQITSLPEYYITRTESAMMQRIAKEIGKHCEDTQAVVEFGSGSGLRSDILLSALPRVLSYIPIDVSAEMLASTARVVESSYPHIRVHPLVADFTQSMQLPADLADRRLGFFPGSTIGNFLPADAVRFLRYTQALLGAESRMLVGVDLAKSVDKLERAYDDAAGVTGQFNKNILTRINDELDADFVLKNFTHQAFFDRDRSRIEMHLVSLADQRVSIDGIHKVTFRAGETIHTENSHKYTLDSFRELANEAGWQSITAWVDDDDLFSIHLLESD